MQTLVRKQQLSCTLQQAWEFFSTPYNLQKITPKEMDFKIITPNLGKIYAGQIIEYTVSPILNIPLTWVTEISHVVDMKYFVDTQLQGPYQVWHHQHFFEKNDQGVLMTDILNYKVPYGILGTLIEKWYVNKKVASIFDFRFDFINKNL